MIFFDVTHTSHSPARTGIQQLTRRLVCAADSQGGLTPLTYDKFWRAWRTLDAGEHALARSGEPGPRSRGAQWSAQRKWRGRVARMVGGKPPLPAGAKGLIAAEFFSREVGAAYRSLFARIDGPRVALFYDTIPLTHPEFTPPGTVARFPAYLDELRQFDAIAAISDYSRESLEQYWRWAGGHAPPVVTIECGIAAPPADSTAPPPAGTPQVLALGTIEGRKNHAALFDAAESLWVGGVDFELHVVGMARRETAATAVDKLEALVAAGRPLHFHGSIDDDAVEARWRACRFSIYPSLVEGFGLPIAESLARGRPCICSTGGAMGELARRGGCVALDRVDATSLADAMRRLIEDDVEYTRLRIEAAARPIRTSAAYLNDLCAWLATVRRASA